MRKTLLVALLSAIVLTMRLSAQQLSTGVYAFGTYDSKGIDTINVGSLNVHMAIPIVTKPGRGLPFNYSLVYESLIWSNSTSVYGDDYWTPDPNFGFHGQLFGAITGTLNISNGTFTCNDGTSGYDLSNWTYDDPYGQAHVFDYDIQGGCDDGSGNGTTGNGSTSDGSGYRLSTSNGTFVYTKNGTQITPTTNLVTGASYAAMTDTNGNTVSNNGDGSFTDTLGVKELVFGGAGDAASPLSLTYPVAEQSDGATSATARVFYKTYTVQTNFGCSGISEYGPLSNDLVDHITLADGTMYSFTYEPTPGVSGAVTGRMNSITLPSSGVITYSYSGTGCGAGINSDGTPVTMQRVTSNGTRTYNRNVSALRYYYDTYFVPCSAQLSYEGFTACSANSITDEVGNETDFTFAVDDGYLYETGHTVWNGPASSGQQLEQKTISLAASGGAVGNGYPAILDGAITYMGIIDSFNGIAPVRTDETFDASGNLLSVNLNNPSPTDPNSAFLGGTQYTYNANSNLTSAVTTNSGETIISSTTWGYDETRPIPTGNIPQHQDVTTPRNNQTSARYWVSGNTYLNSSTNYYDTGAIQSTTTDNGTTNYTLDATQTFTTGTTQPTPVSGVTISTSAAFDKNSGIETSATGATAGQVTTYGQYDRRLRPTQVTTTSSVGGQLNVSYSPNQVSSLTRMNSSQTADQETFLDSYGRTIRTAVRGDLPPVPGQSVPAVNWYLTDYCYDAAGRLKYQSVPYSSSSESPSSYQCSANTGDFYQYDGLNRVIYVSHADGSHVNIAYYGRAVQTTTSASPAVSRITQYNLDGTVAAVCELSSNSNMPNSGSPSACTYSPAPFGSAYNVQMDIAGTGFVTTYAYSNQYQAPVTTITQGSQTRVFKSDGVGRPTYMSEPESGVTTYSYAYNATGLQVVRTRPRANVLASPAPNPIPTTTTTTQYDVLGRPLSITYSDGTPTKTFIYDTYSGAGVQGYSTGQMTYAETGNVTAPTDQETFYYDVMGRVSSTAECLPGWCSSGGTAVRSYQYDAASELVQEQYGTVLGGGSTATIGYAYTNAGQIASVSGGQSGLTSPIFLATSMTPFGPTATQLGNGLYSPATYDGIGQINSKFVCTGSQVPYCNGGQQFYGFVSGTVGGHIVSFADTVENYYEYVDNYDEFGRLSSLAAVLGNTPVLSMNFVYDRYGNRTQQNITTGSGPQPQLSYNTSNNQLTSAGYSYDVAGNVISDGSNTYTYDAENNVVAISGGTNATYTYNALGQRTMTVTNGVTERYGYNLQGQRATSWNSSGALDSAQYYAGGPLAYWSSTDSNLHYQHTDFTGTVRERTNAAGSVEGIYPSLPFGDAFAPVGADTDPAHFATLDHDGAASSGLEHAAFREYHSTSGRWLSPDSYSGSYNIGNPQSMNRYVYALNDPLSLVDPSGLDVCLDDQAKRSRPRAMVGADDGNEPIEPCVVQGEGPYDGSNADDGEEEGDPNVPTVNTPTTPTPNPQVTETVTVTATPPTLQDVQNFLAQQFTPSIYIQPTSYTLLASDPFSSNGGCTSCHVTHYQKPLSCDVDKCTPDQKAKWCAGGKETTSKITSATGGQMGLWTVLISLSPAGAPARPVLVPLSIVKALNGYTSSYFNSFCSM